jgi:hypothetical protein
VTGEGGGQRGVRMSRVRAGIAAGRALWTWGTCRARVAPVWPFSGGAPCNPLLLRTRCVHAHKHHNHRRHRRQATTASWLPAAWRA